MRRARLAVALSTVAAVAVAGWIAYAKLWATHPLTGEVFIQMRNGALQYAPAAEVIAFRSDGARGREWMKAHTSAYEKFLPISEKYNQALPTLLKSNPSKLPAATRYIQSKLYEFVGDAVREVRQKVMPNGATNELIEATCDANGRFEMRLPAGEYWIIAEGRVGEVNGIWARTVIVPSAAKLVFRDSDSTLDRQTDE